MTQNQIAFQNLKETQRTNLARESETQRSNIARETETARSNRAGEGLGRDNLAQRAFEYSDMADFNKAHSVASTAQLTTKAAQNVTRAAKDVADTIYTAKKTANPLSGIIGS